MEHMGCKTLNFQGEEPFWLWSGISCSLAAFSRLKMSDWRFALDRPHTATEPAATRMLRSPGEESAQAETHSLPWSGHWDWALLLNTMSQQPRDEQRCPPWRAKDR